MTKKSLIFPIAFAAFASVALLGATACSPTESEAAVVQGERAKDGEGNLAEAPTITYDQAGQVTVRFAAEDSPRLERGWNTTTRTRCAVGYRLKTRQMHDHDGHAYDEGRCEVNPPTG